MSGAQGNALDWALALAKAPSERHALRQRGLPADIDALIQLAGGGAGDALAQATSRTGESPARIVESARFYLREVLFFPEADAYRLLGVASDAEQGRIRSHHRLLQQWLHPDRSSEEDAMFAARVNAAWDQVRNPDRRAAYDLSHPALPMESPVADAVHALRPWIPVSVPEFLDMPAEERWRRRVPLLVLLAACIALGVVTVQHQQRLDEAGALPLARAIEDVTPVLRMPPRGVDPAQVTATRREPPASKPVPSMKRAAVALAQNEDMAGDDPFQAFTVVDDPEFAIPDEQEDEQAFAAATHAATPPLSPEKASRERINSTVTFIPVTLLASAPMPATSRAQPQRASVAVAAPQARALEPVMTANASSTVAPVS